MADPRGFLTYPRVSPGYRGVAERVKDFAEVDALLPVETLHQQAARCMDCGIPFCHAAGCPVLNRIPEFNDLVYQGRWREAADNLHSTNNFPEITGRVCPAPCEPACTLAINADPVTIKHIELQIAERAFNEGWIEPAAIGARTGRRVAVVGSGPAGLAAAQQLVRAGHKVVVFEKDDRVGGLLRYGIPDFKLDKDVLDRRLAQMIVEGVKFETDVNVGIDVSTRYLRKSFDAICLCLGAGEPRPLEAPGAELGSVHFAMDFLRQQNRTIAGDDLARRGETLIHAAGKHVVVIGGGDTGSDCVGTSIRQGAVSVTQLEILPKPPEGANPDTPWPAWPRILRTSSSQEEGCARRWSVQTRSLTGECGHVTHLHGCEVEWTRGPKGWQMRERPGSDFTIKADLVLVAMGFLHVVHAGLVNPMGITLDGRGNVAVANHATHLEGVFAAGDAVRGASLVVHAIHAGRQAARAINAFLASK
ncbi:MAG: glutamate synthase subunit beta [Pirellulales bacterium]|nr:glutamate synthase subunit beta [Pirellulales bacterium]